MIGLPDAIRAGGQTGADQGALRAGLTLGFLPGSSLGGWAPRGFQTENGLAPWLRTRYGLQESPFKGYEGRTTENVREADQVLLFGHITSPGSRLTISLCRTLGKPYWVNPTRGMLRELAWGNVMVAGNRESGNRGIEAWVYWMLVETWKQAAGAQLRVTRAPVLIEPVTPKLSNFEHWSPA